MNEIFISEGCSYCGENFEHVEDIYVDVEEDQYICLKCAVKHKIRVNKCLDYSESEDF